MKTIYKYTLKDVIGSPQAIMMPEGARILSTGYLPPAPDTPDGTLNVWAVVEPSAPKRSRWFVIHFTGSYVTDPVSDAAYVGRIEISRGGRNLALQLHVFDIGFANEGESEEVAQ